MLKNSNMSATDQPRPADIGGGYPEHDLSDLTLHFVVGLIADKLALDLRYLAGISGAALAPWGGATTHGTRGFQPRMSTFSAYASAASRSRRPFVARASSPSSDGHAVVTGANL